MIKHVEFQNKNGLMLRGYLNIPDKAKNLVIMFHGYTGNKTEHNGLFRKFSRELEKLNIASLRMDYSNNGESDGEFINFRFNEAVEDAKQMIDFGRTIDQIKSISLVGFSMGGAIAALVCNYQPLAKVLLISPAGKFGQKSKKSFELAKKDEHGNIPSPAFTVTPGLINSYDGFNPYENVHKFTNPVLVIHGTKDLAVDYKDGVEFSDKFANASIYLVEEAGHGYDNITHFNKMVEKSINFLKL